jgi:hypothetical protein
MLRWRAGEPPICLNRQHPGKRRRPGSPVAKPPHGSKAGEFTLKSRTRSRLDGEPAVRQPLRAAWWLRWGGGCQPLGDGLEAVSSGRFRAGAVAGWSAAEPSDARLTLE